MKNASILLFLVVYISAIFMMPNYYTLPLIFLHIALALWFKISLVKIASNIKGTILYILFIVIFNVILDSTINAIFTGYKLFLACNITYIFSYILTPSRLSNAIYTLCIPLKIFKVNIEDLSLIITIAISFIPILSNEINTIKNVMKSKNYKLKVSNSYIIISVYFNSVLNKIQQLDLALRAKGYE